MNQIFTHGCSFEKGPQKQVHHHFIMETRMCIMEHIMCNPYYMVVDERLFLMDKEDKINLKDETPSGTSRIQLRKEMNMILTPPLTTEIKEDDASQLYYMTLKFMLTCYSSLKLRPLRTEKRCLMSAWRCDHGF
ncbi:uncharacterized protein LOC142627899 isoform X2 [Castanea sativa]|uniref:uncharacterized protein LOC142627899 isoform X2 n=1 Tax=Castanea sativa TaxID=21020 RepID=UPI003F6515F8